MHNNVSFITDCYGCGVCATVCAKSIIKIILNKEGFYEPMITNPDMCTGCGLCIKVCSFSAEKSAVENDVIGAYSVWSNNPAVRQKCSSGGVTFELESKAIQEGSKVCACRYDVGKARAEHYLAETTEDLYPSIGSKYIQSYSVNGFKAINFKNKNLVVGTPCQIDSIRRLIRLKKVEDNFVLIDFFCHGVPSMLLWKKYLKEAEKKVGEITYVSWRNKLDGWQDSYVINIDGTNNCDTVGWHGSYNLKIRERNSLINSKRSQRDPFYELFLGNHCLGKACYANCKYKRYASSADIRVGDMWGDKFKDCKEGVSVALTLTEKGDVYLKSLDNCTINSENIKVAISAQMLKNVEKPWDWELTMALIKSRFFSTKLTFYFVWALNKFLKCFV